MKSVEFDPEYKKALQFLLNGLKTNRNPKPVGEHSILVANRLYKYDYGVIVVTAALLHDLIEDTDVKLEDIQNKFGTEVAKVVELMTYDSPGLSLQDRWQAFEASTHKIILSGANATALEAADFIENSYFYEKADSAKLRSYLKKKYEFFLKEAKPLLKDSPLWKDLEQAYDKNVKN